jgi:hypothetical protein
MVALPSDRALQSMVRLNLLQNCPITYDDIKNASAIWGSDIANIRGKTTHCKPDRVETNYVDIPRALLSAHINVTLVADVMFVNGVPFLVSVSCNINLITIEHASKHTASKLGYLLQCIVNVYTRGDLRVQRVLMGTKFEPVCEHVPSVDMNTPAMAEHIAEIERRIRYIKERARGILCWGLYAGHDY